MSHKTRVATEEEKGKFLDFIENDAYMQLRLHKNEQDSIKESLNTREFIKVSLKNNTLNITEFDGSNLKVYHSNMFNYDEEGHVNMYDLKYLHNTDRNTFEDLESCDYFVG